jgi:hypothetical protein
MSGSAPTNNQAVQFEQEQAAEADQKEADRQARLTQGQTLIDQIFNGSPVMGTKTSNYDWSTFSPGSPAFGKAASVPAGYTAVQIPAATTPGTPGSAATGYSTPARKVAGTDYAGTSTGTTRKVAGTDYVDPPAYGAGAGAGAAPTWGLEDASGNITKQGDPLSLTTQYDTGQKTGGFDDAFYDAYKQKVLDYYQPDEQRQYDEAQRDLTYSLARAGTLQSSTAADKQGELAYNDALQKANIVANANTQEGNLKSQIQSNKQALINQLYATEDPTLTANLAESSAAASRLQDPMLTPAAALFTPALTTVGSAVQGLLYPSGAGGSAFANQQSSPTPASASGTKSGQLTL